MTQFMTWKELALLHRELTSEALRLMEGKNHDYAGGSEDRLANFRTSEMIGIPAELGILMRCLDKFQRIRAFVTTGTLKVKEEPVRDAILDVINYMVLLAACISERTRREQGEPS